MTPRRHAPGRVLAWSEARVDESESRGPHIALWRPEGTSVAIGIGQDPMLELEVDAMQRDGVGLLRRQSGGGAVLLYEGVLCWEAWAGFEEIEKRADGDGGIRAAYRALCRPVRDALAALGCESFHAGICDISCNADGGDAPPRKLAGTAQLRRKNMALVHGSLLVNPDLEMLSRYLRFPSAQPDYRADRPHRRFCVSAAEALGGGDGALLSRIADAVSLAAEGDGWRVLTPCDREGDERADALARDKYGSDEWNWERKRNF